MVHATMLLELNGVITKMDYSSGNQMGNFFLVIPFKLSKLQMHIAIMMSIHFHFRKINLRACEQLLMNAFLDLQHELTVMIQKNYPHHTNAIQVSSEEKEIRPLHH